MAQENRNEQGDSCSNCCFSCLFCLGPMPSKKDLKPSKSTLERPVYSTHLPDNLKDGSTIRVTGRALPNCFRFSINLITAHEDGDIAFHFNPRLVERYVVRNCKIQGVWGTEETTSISKFDINQYQNFTITMLVANEEFMVSLNGRHLCAYGFRIPLPKVKFLEVVGNVDVKKVDFGKVTSYPESNTAEAFKIPILQGDFVATLSENLQTPISATLPTPLVQGWQLNIFGRVKILPHSFYINLQNGKQIWPHPIIPLHINPRFNTLGGDNIVVRNAWYNSWGPEERTPNFNFSAGTPFNLTIRKDPDYFSVYVDQNLIGEFRFRGPHDKIDTLHIQGDVIINQITMEKRFNDNIQKKPKT